MATAFSRWMSDVALAVARLGEAIRPRVIERADLIVAATAQVHNLTILTRNIRHFAPTRGCRLRSGRRAARLTDESKPSGAGMA